jgi:hypothetical protein
MTKIVVISGGQPSPPWASFWNIVRPNPDLKQSTQFHKWRLLLTIYQYILHCSTWISHGFASGSIDWKSLEVMTLPEWSIDSEMQEMMHTLLKIFPCHKSYKVFNKQFLSFMRNGLTNQRNGGVVKGSPILKCFSLHNACWHSQWYASIKKHII